MVLGKLLARPMSKDCGLLQVLQAAGTQSDPDLAGWTVMQGGTQVHHTDTLTLDDADDSDDDGERQGRRLLAGTPACLTHRRTGSTRCVLLRAFGSAACNSNGACI